VAFADCEGSDGNCDDHHDSYYNYLRVIVRLCKGFRRRLPQPENDNEEQSQPEVASIVIPEEKRFRKLVRRMEPWYAVTAYAYHKGGAA